MIDIPKRKPKPPKGNPLFNFSGRGHFVPAWDQIRPQDVRPALEYAARLTLYNVERIKRNKNRPTFKNTVEALETAGELFNYLYYVVVNTPPGTKKEEQYRDRLERWMSEIDAELSSAIYSDSDLYVRFERSAANTRLEDLTPEQKKLVKVTRDTFLAFGIKLDPLKKKRVQELFEESAELATIFQQNIEDAEDDFLLVVQDENDLEGLPQFAINAAARLAAQKGHTGKWAFSSRKSEYVPFIQTVRNRGLRRRMWEGYHSKARKGEYSNEKVALKLTRINQQMAELLGYKDTAALNLEYTMTRNTRRVSSFLEKIRKAARPVAQHELDVLRAFARKVDGIKTLQPWDVRYYQARLQKAALGYEEEDLRKYFKFGDVLQATFRHYEKFLHLRFVETDKYPRYHKDVRAFNVYNTETGKFRGVLYLDPFDRPYKPAGTAWDDNVLHQGLFQGRVRRPINVAVTKFLGEQLNHYDVRVLVHEIGHAVNNFASECRYQALSGFNVDSDFIEFASMFNENFAYEPEFLKDASAGALSDEMVQKIARRRQFMGGLETLRETAKGYLSLAWTRSSAAKATSLREFEEAALKKYRVMPHHNSVLSHHFHHIFGGGYDTVFFSYQKAASIADAGMHECRRRGLYDPDIAGRVEKVFAAGNTEDNRTLARSITGRTPQIDHYLSRQGLLKEQFDYSAALTMVGAKIPGTRRSHAPAIS